mgnify:CR=1 FL=1
MDFTSLNVIFQLSSRAIGINKQACPAQRGSCLTVKPALPKIAKKRIRQAHYIENSSSKLEIKSLMYFLSLSDLRKTK